MMNIDHLTVEDPRWGEALSRLQHDFYHLPEYAALEGALNDASPRAFSARNGDRELFIPYLLRRCDRLFPGKAAAEGVCDVVSPYGYPGFLLSRSAAITSRFTSEAVDGLSQSLREQGVCSAFFRMNPILNDPSQRGFPEGFFSSPSDTVAIDLTLDEARIWDEIRHGHQYVIAKCRKLGFVPRMVPFANHIDDFMTVYQETMDRVKARESYYFGRTYFEKLAELPEHVYCCLVDFEDEIAAACVFFECDGVVQAHLGGSLSKYRKQSPFHLSLHHAALWAKSRGNRLLHLGGGVGGADDRLFEFKRGFSDMILTFSTVRLITDQEKYDTLTGLRAATAGMPVGELIETDYFPAYRARSQEVAV